MKYRNLIASAAALATSCCQACDSCFGPVNRVEHVRSVKRMQPDAYNATYGPTRALPWGQLNFLHTLTEPRTDTHGWLEGHLTETNYGADWGDFVSFSSHMKAKARAKGVDLLLIDTGDLHDGAGLSDATAVDGSISNIVFENIDYDLLTIGNHELYLADVAYQDFQNFSRFWGDKYLTSNVQILNADTGEFQYLGNQYRHFTTERGLRILAFGVLFDFTGETNVTKVIPAATMVNQTWFVDAISTTDPVDLFLVIGHNTVLRQNYTGTFGYVHDAIRKVKLSTPIQFFGGHSHIRDFKVYDEASTALESGRYCETLGWLSMTGFNQTNSGYNGSTPNCASSRPIRKATNNSASAWSYARRYLDWNRLTFEFHALGSQTNQSSFDTTAGLSTTSEITSYRKELNLTVLYGCTPQPYCISCAEFNSSGSIFTLLSEAMSTVVVNPARTDRSRISIINTGSIRFDLHKGPFTYDDAFIVSPFNDIFVYIQDVPYSLAAGALANLNAKAAVYKRDIGSMQISPRSSVLDNCVDPFLAPRSDVLIRDEHAGHQRRQVVETDGYTTNDDFGTDGDDTVHSAIKAYSYPHFFQGTAGFPSDGSDPDVVDLIFIDYLESDFLTYLGSNYTSADILYVIDDNFSTRTYLPLFVQQSELFQQNLNNCSIY